MWPFRTRQEVTTVNPTYPDYYLVKLASKLGYVWSQDHYGWVQIVDDTVLLQVKGKK